MRLQGKVAIISGAARGIGAALASTFVDEGACVVVADLLELPGEALVESLNSAKRRHCAQFVHADATRAADWAGAVEAAERNFGGLTTLVNNAGVHGRLGLEDTTEYEWHRVIDADLKSAWLGMKACIPAMRRAGGAIVNTSSVYGLIASGRATAYHSAKGGVLMLSKAAAVQYAPEKIRVNCIHPGLIDTPMTQSLPPAWKESLLQMTPLRRFGHAREVAQAVVFLVSDEASFITGASLVIDGGLTAV